MRRPWAARGEGRALGTRVLPGMSKVKVGTGTGAPESSEPWKVTVARARSEERRVGKGCRCRRGRKAHTTKLNLPAGSLAHLTPRPPPAPPPKTVVTQHVR